MKSIFKTLFTILLVLPLFMSAQDDTEVAVDVKFITGSLQLDDKGEIYLLSTDCKYTGNYYLAGGLPEDIPGKEYKKQNKKNKKSNKAVAKKIAKFTKKAAKADGKTLPNREVKCILNEEARTINPLKVISPMYEPKILGLTPLCDATLMAIYALYLETERIKKLTRVVTFTDVVGDDDEVAYTFYDRNCNTVQIPELELMMPEIKSVLKQANIALGLNIAAVAVVLANTKAIKEELKAAGGLATITGMKSLVEAGIFQVRLVNDNARLRKRIKECKNVLKGFGFTE